VPPDRRDVGLPPKPFLYTPDQVATLVSLDERSLRSRMLWYEGREVGVPPRDKLRAINISAPENKPEWRISEQELIRWMKAKGMKYYERGWAR